MKKMLKGSCEKYKLWVELQYNMAELYSKVLKALHKMIIIHIFIISISKKFNDKQLPINFHFLLIKIN